METILLLAHTEADGSLAKSVREALHAARTLNKLLAGSNLVVGLVGENVQAAANSIAACPATKYFGVTGKDFAPSRYASDAAAAEAICKAAQATIAVAPATSRWARVLPGVAQRLGGRTDTHVTGVADAGGKPAINRWYYRQRMEATLTRAQRPWFILIDPGSQTACECGAGTAKVEAVAVNLPESGKRTTVVGIREPKADAQTIRPDAELLFVTGAGWTKKQADGQTHVSEAEKLIRGFLQVSRASLGSSKSLVDLGGEGQAVLSFLSHLNQVGQTGATPRHAKGLSTCCHGEEPHTVGWRFINERRAISRPELRLGPRKSRRALRGRRLQGDGKSERVAGSEEKLTRTRDWTKSHPRRLTGVTFDPVVRHFSLSPFVRCHKSVKKNRNMALQFLDQLLANKESNFHSGFVLIMRRDHLAGVLSHIAGGDVPELVYRYGLACEFVAEARHECGLCLAKERGNIAERACARMDFGHLDLRTVTDTAAKGIHVLKEEITTRLRPAVAVLDVRITGTL